MKRMTKVRMGVDICLTVLLPVLMAEILTGQEFHEWAGTVIAGFRRNFCYGKPGE